MAAPTQAYPPWLSPLPLTVTQDGTVVVQTTVIQFPQTYYGPSIPLGSGWVFGGSTFPASIATSSAASTTASVPTTTPASTFSQSQTTSPSATASTSAPASTSQSPSTSAPASSSSGSASTPASNASHGLSSGTRLAVILSTILGTLLLAALLVVLCHIRRRQRRRGLAPEGNFSWFMVDNSSPQPPVEATAEEGEGAAFLTGEHGMREQEHERGPVTLPAWPKPPPTHPQSYEPMALAAPNTASTSGSGSGGTKTDSSTVDSAAKREDLARFNASSSTADVGSLFFNPGPGEGSGLRRSDEHTAEETALAAGVAAALASTPSKDYTTRPPGAGAPRVPTRSPARPLARSATPTSPTGLYFHPASPPNPTDEEGMYDNDIHRFGALRARESLDEDAEEQFLPPRRLDPDRVFHSHSSQPDSAGSRGSWVYPDSPPSETDERATLLTARRVNVGPVTHPVPVLASPPLEKRQSEEGWVSPTSEDESEEKPARASLSPGNWATAVGMGGLSGFARGLGRLSWFRRMSNEPGPSGTRHSSPTRSRSRPGSMVGFARPVSRPHSGLLHPSFGSRPQSAVSFRGVEAELGLRPPGTRVSAAGSEGAGSGSGKSGATVYHSASSRPRTPFYVTGQDHTSHEAQEAFLTLPPADLDLGEAGNTIRSVDVLDLPAPERTLPFSPSVLPDPSSSRGPRHDSGSSRATGSGVGLAFPPGLVAVPQWDKGSQSSSSKGRDVLEDEPPRAGGDWSSLRSKGSNPDEENGGSGRRRGGPVTRSSTGEVSDPSVVRHDQSAEGALPFVSQQAVRVVMGERTASETASISSGPRHPSEPGSSALPASPRSPATLGFALTPRVSMYTSSQSDLVSHSGSGSHSSRPSRHTLGSHAHEPSQHSSSNHDSEDGHPPSPPGAHFHRASLSAMGGEGGPPQLPPMGPLSHMQAPMEPTNEEREPEDGSETASRAGTGTSRPMSEQTHTGTFASGTTSTGAQTTVPSTTGSYGKL